jgi:4-amino-4-deoxy-L-arabinose transferase-like glycosyltransferase
MVVQALLSLRLLHANAAFLDETTYIDAGRQLLYAWLHGGPNLHYAAYFSGAPVIYPVMAAVANWLGGLTGVRLLSLVFMLATTGFCYDSARRLYGRQAGYFAAAAFATCEGTLFLGSFATFDAMAVMLVALAAWLVIRAAVADRSGAGALAALYIAAPVMALANATKYASALYDLVIIAMAFFLVAGRYDFRTAIRTSLTLAALVGGLLATLLALGGSDYIQGVNSTTVARPHGNTALAVVVHESVSWVGAIAGLALICALGLAIACTRHRASWATGGLGATLALAALAAPLNQLRIHTSVSLTKHVDFGAWFGALVIGYGFSWLVGRRRSTPGAVDPSIAPKVTWSPEPPTRNLRPLHYALIASILAPMLLAGTHQSLTIFKAWPNSDTLVATLRPLVAETKGPILVTDDTPEYYLGNPATAGRWRDTFYFAYTPPGLHRTVTGPSAFSQAIHNGYFSIISVNLGSTTRQADEAIARAVSTNHSYHFVKVVHAPATFGTGTYVVWRLDPPAHEGHKQ